MAKLRDHYDDRDRPSVSPSTARIVQDGTAIDTIGAALDAPSDQRSALGLAILKAYVEAWDAGALMNERCVGSLNGKYAHYLKRDRPKRGKRGG